MILVHATLTNTTETQLVEAAKLLKLWRDSGFQARSTTLQLDETTGYIAMVFDHCAHGVSYDPWTTVQIEVDADGLYRLWSRKNGWTDWQPTAL